MTGKSVFSQIVREHRYVRYRLDDIDKKLSILLTQVPAVNITETNLVNALPTHLRKTYLVVLSMGEANAQLVSNATTRNRAVESNYLNQLVRMGWLVSRRYGKCKLFKASGKEIN